MTKLLLTVPTKWAICACCEGNGTVTNPAFSNGFTSEQWADMRLEFDDAGEESAADKYLRGDMDVVCRDCKGAGKLRVPDVSRMTYEQKRFAVGARAEERARFEYDEIAAAERRMGA